MLELSINDWYRLVSLVSKNKDVPIDDMARVRSVVSACNHEKRSGSKVQQQRKQSSKN